MNQKKTALSEGKPLEFAKTDSTSLIFFIILILACALDIYMRVKGSLK